MRRITWARSWRCAGRLARGRSPGDRRLPGYFSVAVKATSGTAASAFEIGQFFFEKSTFSLKRSWLTPGTSATVVISIFVIVGPASRCTVADVSILVGG